MTVLDRVPPLTADDDSVDATLARYRAHLSKGRATVAELFGSHLEVTSEGAWLWTADDEEFLNCGGYGVLLMGARHPLVVEAVRRQLDEHPTATRVLLEPVVGRAAELLCAVTPAGLDRVHFGCGGAEAVETAIKLGRAHGRRRLVSMRQGYHGKSIGALSATAKDVYQQPFRPLLADTVHLPFGDGDALEQELADHPGECTVILEPVQGEGGVVLPPTGYLPRVERLCREHGAFFILDEVQTGLGRLGSWWGADLYGVTPDVLVTGKALGGGVLPVSAAVATRAAFAPFDKDPYLHTATFSGHPLLMAAVSGAIRAIREDDLVERARVLGERLLPEITRIAHANCGDLVTAVRGQGLLIGIELVEAGLAGELLIELFNNSVVANHSMTASSVVRLTPPAVFGEREIGFLLNAFDHATRDLVAKGARMPEGR
jgi:putrescine aminotransferase